MARKKSPVNQLQQMSFGEFETAMDKETASILTDYVRQYIGVISSNTPQAGSGIFMNWDRVQRTQTYQELAWYDLYDEVEHDPHISAILSSAKMNVACLDWHIEPFGLSTKNKKAKATARDEAIAQFVDDNLRGLENFTQDVYEFMDAIGKGFSCSEIIWTYRL
jgi:phage gp29-like protein